MGAMAISMNTVPAAEVKRRGIAALEDALKKGPAHIIKSNRPSCVVLSEEDYATLLAKNQPNYQAVDLWNLLEKRPWQGTRTKKDIDIQIKKERDSWNKE
jgi:hypothetical protein